MAVQICSDFIRPEPDITAFRRVDRKTRKASLILVPAKNARFEGDITGKLKNHYRRRQKVAYVNAAEFGDTLIYCTDHNASDVLAQHAKFTPDRTIYRVPKECEAVLINEIHLGNKDDKDELIALGPLLRKADHTRYFQFHMRYTRAGNGSRGRHLEEFCSGREFRAYLADLENGNPSSPLQLEKIKACAFHSRNFTRKRVEELNLLTDVVWFDLPIPDENVHCPPFDDALNGLSKIQPDVLYKPELLALYNKVVLGISKVRAAFLKQRGISPSTRRRARSGSDSGGGGGGALPEPGGSLQTPPVRGGVTAASEGLNPWLIAFRLIKNVLFSKKPAETEEDFPLVETASRTHHVSKRPKGVGYETFEARFWARFVDVYDLTSKWAELSMAMREVRMEWNTGRRPGSTTSRDQLKALASLKGKRRQAILFRYADTQRIRELTTDAAALLVKSLLTPKSRAEAHGSGKAISLLRGHAKVTLKIELSVAFDFYKRQNERATFSSLFEPIRLAICSLDPSQAAQPPGTEDLVREAGISLEFLAASLISHVEKLTKEKRIDAEEAACFESAAWIVLIDGVHMRTHLGALLQKAEASTRELQQAIIHQVGRNLARLIASCNSYLAELKREGTEMSDRKRLAESVCQDGAELYAFLVIYEIWLEDRLN